MGLPVVAYIGRPGISPAVAALVALGRIRPSQRVLDVGCGTGTDALTLASWGFRDVLGIDPDAKAVAVARARATRARLGPRVRFEAVAAEDLASFAGPARFDVVLHTLVANNLRERQGDHFRNVAAVMPPGGLLVLHERVTVRDAKARPGAIAPLAALLRHFHLTPSVTTQLAERPTQRGPPHARVALWLGTPRGSRASSGRAPRME
jgi:2-polyprenyl-3-methyl-5-hydroxy-6-metoxy-1,4-benzoquinol methylase